jgi:mono/diheme cytochrome c family protein
MRQRGWTAIGCVVTAVATAAAEAPDGKRLYAAYCASCHGADARGNGPDADMFSPRPPSLRGEALTRESDDGLVEWIRHGKPLPLVHDPAKLHRRAGDVDVLVAHLQRLPTLRWSEIERGEELYVDKCEICHGPFGRPPAVLPPGVRTPRILSDPAWQRTTSDETLLDRVRHGHRAMPAISDMDVPENRAGLLAFVRLLSPGYERYSRFCAACHGDDGRGPGTDWATEKRPSVVFDRAYFAKKDPEALRRDVWHMLDAAEPQMPHMSRVLRPSDARAVVGYLRGLP